GRRVPPHRHQGHPHALGQLFRTREPELLLAAHARAVVRHGLRRRPRSRPPPRAEPLSPLLVTARNPAPRLPHPPPLAPPTRPHPRRLARNSHSVVMRDA